MKDVALHLANAFFYVFHTVLIVFNLLGWLYPRTRKLNLIILVGDLRLVGAVGVLERLGLLFFDRLALPGAAGFGGKGNAFELYRLFNRKNNGPVPCSGACQYAHGLPGVVGFGLFALGES